MAQPNGYHSGTGYYSVEEEDDFFADDFGNDDAPAPKAPTNLKVTLQTVLTADSKLLVSMPGAV